MWQPVAEQEEGTGGALVHTGYMREGSVSGKLTRNLRLVDMGLEDAPTDGHLLACRASCLVELSRPAEALVAIGFWESAHARWLPPPQLRVVKIRALVMERDLPSALECVREGIANYPGDSALMFMEANPLGHGAHLGGGELPAHPPGDR